MIKMARVRVKAARRLRDKHLLRWIRSRVAFYEEDRQRREEARIADERKQVEDLENAKKRALIERRKRLAREEEEARWKAEAEERARLRLLEDERLEQERLE